MCFLAPMVPPTAPPFARPITRKLRATSIHNVAILISRRWGVSTAGAGGFSFSNSTGAIFSSVSGNVSVLRIAKEAVSASNFRCAKTKFPMAFPYSRRAENCFNKFNLIDLLGKRLPKISRKRCQLYTFGFSVI